MLKYLRIAVTVLGATACAVLILLWTRSYGMEDTVRAPIPGMEGRMEVISLNGRASVVARLGGEPWSFRIHSSPAMWAGLGCTSRYDFAADLPYWNLTVVAGMMAGLPWIRWRFSLRTLLIAMTLLSVVLGMIATSKQSAEQRSTAPLNYPKIEWGKIWR